MTRLTLFSLRLFSQKTFNSDLSLIRNIGISAHIDSGKTTLSERILYYTGRISRIHEVRGRDGVGAKMDSMELEREKGITIQSAATNCKWKGGVWINLIDTPGHVDFTIEVERALRVLDGAILVVCGVSGVQSQTMTVDRQMQRYRIPRLVFINKLDRAGADPWIAIERMRGKLGLNAAAVQIPIGLEDELHGLIDVVEQKAWKFEGEHGEHVIETDIPQTLLERVKEKRARLIEAVAEVDEPLFDAFLTESTVSARDLKDAIRRCTINRTFVPVFMGSAYKNCGVQLLLDGVTDYLPDPRQVENYALDVDNNRHLLNSNTNEPLVALAFKLEEGRFGQLTYIRVYRGILTKGASVINVQTGKRLKIPRLVRMHSNEMEDVDAVGAGEICAVFGVECSTGDTFTEGSMLSMTPMHVPDPVISLAVKPISNEAADKFSKALARFQREDPTLRVHTDPESNETILSGMGELHLDIYLERMRREYACTCTAGKPQVAYRETITKRATFDYLHKKQTGGAGQFARVMGYIEPQSEDNRRNDFINEVVGGTVPTVFIPACEKGFIEAVSRGPLIGHQVIGIQFHLQEGVAHVVDSNEYAFRTATINGFRQAYERAGPVILEPIMKAVIMVPSEFQGTVMSSLTKRRGIILDSETSSDGSTMTITVAVPLADMFGYSTELRSATQGKGEFSMEYAEHRAMPKDLQESLLESRKVLKN